MVMNNCPVADVYGLLHGSVISKAAQTKEASRAAGKREREQSFMLDCRRPCSLFHAAEYLACMFMAALCTDCECLLYRVQNVLQTPLKMPKRILLQYAHKKKLYWDIFGALYLQ